jgi:TP901 family phage tail tape measure protein
MDKNVLEIVAKLDADVRSFIDKFDAAVKKTEALTEAERAHQALMTVGTRVTQDMLSAQEKYSQKTEHLSTLLKAGAISEETYNRAMAASKKELDLASGAEAARIKLQNEGKSVTQAATTAQEQYGQKVKQLDTLLKAGAISEETYNRSLTAAKKDLDAASGAEAARLKVEAEGKAVIQATMTAQEKYNEKIKDAERLLKAGAISQDTYKRAMVAAEKELAGVHKSMSERFAALGQGIDHVGQKMSSMGGTIVKWGGIVGGGLAGAAVAVIKTSSSFESAFAGVKKTVDATDAEFAKLRKGILDMALTIPVGQVELANIMESAGSLGVSGVDNLLKFTRTAAMLGTATNMSSADAATALAKFSNITGTAIGDVDRLGATLVDLGNKTAATESQIMDMSLRLAGAANSANYTDDQIFALAASLSSVGIEAEMGGSSMSRFISMVDLATLTGAGTTKELGKMEKAEQKVEKGADKVAKAMQTAADRTADLDQRGRELRIKMGELQEQLMKLDGQHGKTTKSNITLANQKEKLRDRIEALQRKLADLSLDYTKVNRKVGDAVTAQQRLSESVDGQSTSLTVLARVSGMTEEAFTRLYKINHVAALQSFFEGMKKAKDAGQNLDLIINELGVKEIRLIDTMKRTTGAAKLLGETIGVSAAAFKNNTALAEEARKRYTTFDSQVTLLWNNFKNLMITVGTPFLKPLNNFISENMVPRLKELAEWAEKNGAAIETWAKEKLKLAKEKLGELVGWITQNKDAIVTFTTTLIEKAITWGPTVMGSGLALYFGGTLVSAIGNSITLLGQLKRALEVMAAANMTQFFTGTIGSAGTAMSVFGVSIPGGAKGLLGIAVSAGAAVAAGYGLAACFEMLGNKDRTNFIQRWVDQFEGLRKSIDACFDWLEKLRQALFVWGEEEPQLNIQLTNGPRGLTTGTSGASSAASNAASSFSPGTSLALRAPAASGLSSLSSSAVSNVSNSSRITQNMSFQHVFPNMNPATLTVVDFLKIQAKAAAAARLRAGG